MGAAEPFGEALTSLGHVGNFREDTNEIRIIFRFRGIKRLENSAKPLFCSDPVIILQPSVFFHWKDIPQLATVIRITTAIEWPRPATIFHFMLVSLASCFAEFRSSTK